MEQVQLTRSEAQTRACVWACKLPPLPPECTHTDQPGPQEQGLPRTFSASQSSRRTFQKTGAWALASNFPRTLGGAMSVGEGQPPLASPT